MIITTNWAELATLRLTLYLNDFKRDLLQNPMIRVTPNYGTAENYLEEEKNKQFLHLMEFTKS